MPAPANQQTISHHYVLELEFTPDTNPPVAERVELQEMLRLYPEKSLDDKSEYYRIPASGIVMHTYVYHYLYVYNRLRGKCAGLSEDEAQLHNDTHIIVDILPSVYLAEIKAMQFRDFITQSTGIVSAEFVPCIKAGEFHNLYRHWQKDMESALLYARFIKYQHEEN